MNKKNWIKFLILFSAVVLFATYAVIVKIRKPPEQIRVELPVRVTTPTFGTLEQTIKLAGFVANDSTVTVFPRVAGTLLKLNVKTGDNVYAGQILGKIDSEPYEFQFNQAKAAYTAASSSWERVKNLYGSDSLSQQTYDRAKAEFEAARSQYDMAKLQLDYTEITSPVRGTVLKIHTAQGNTAAQSAPVLTIGSTDAVKINLAVPERYFTLFENSLIAKRDAIYAEIPVLDDKRFGAQVQTVAPYLTPQTRTFDVECTLINAAQVRAGMFARVYAVADKKTETYILPYKVLTGGGTLWYVEDSIAKKMTYKPIFEGDDGFAVPEEYAAYHFIAEGQHFLQEGDTVRLMQD